MIVHFDYFVFRLISFHSIPLTYEKQQIFFEFKVNVLGDEVRFCLRPGVLPNVRVSILFLLILMFIRSPHVLTYLFFALILL